MTTLKIYLIAGEASGDVLGSLLMRALRAAHGDVQFFGIGGPLMVREGMHTLFPMQTLSVMGLAEILPKLKDLLGRIRQTAEHIEKTNPDIVITIDAPDFSFRVVRAVQENDKAKPLLLHYVAPTVWAWRAGRAKKVAELYDGIICLFPFEPPYFQRHQLPSAYVGHPVMEQGYVDASGTAIRAELGIAPEDKVIGLMFGSRAGEVARHGALLHDIAQKMQKDTPNLHILIPAMPHLENSIREHLKDLKNVHIFYDPDRKPEIFAAMNAAMAVSGTVALELAVANVPHVIAYTMNAATYQVARRLVRVRFAHLANLLLNKETVPEFIQDACDVDKIAAELKPLLKEGHDTEVQRAEFATVRKMLHGKTKDAPSVQAARFVLDLYKQKSNTAFVPYARAE